MIEIVVHADIECVVSIGGQWLDLMQQVRASHRKVLVVAPAFVADSMKFRAGSIVEKNLLFVTPEGEAQKEFSTVEQLWNLLGQEEFGRRDAIVAVGGGATTDLAGFVAATWLRGISWYAIPTTLAGMVDASVGGKTGINTSAGKNLVGSFHSPRAVCSDISWLDDLSDRDFSAGLAEVIKTGFIRDLSILQLLDAVENLSGARSVAYDLVAKSVAVKAEVVSADFKEGKLREILNFGHTLGHAIEKSAKYQLRHGEAIAIGLHFAALLSESELGFNSIDTNHLKEMLQKFQLPIHVRRGEFQFSQVLALMTGDKKSRDGRIRFIGLRSPGEPDWIEGVSSELLEETYEKITI